MKRFTFNILKHKMNEDIYTPFLFQKLSFDPYENSLAEI
jgi:hypothetical protein